MNRRSFAAGIAEKTGHPASAVEAILVEAIAALAGELAKVGRFDWRGFGTFAVRTYPARRIHNPATGKTIELPARRSVAFKPSTRLRSKLTQVSSSRRPARSRKRPPPRQPRNGAVRSVRSASPVGRSRSGGRAAPVGVRLQGARRRATR